MKTNRFDYRGQYAADRKANERAVLRAEMVVQEAIQRFEAKENNVKEHETKAIQAKVKIVEDFPFQMPNGQA